MSYCRFEDNCDVYVYFNGEFLVCESCRIKNGKFYATKRRSRMISHLEDHVSAGNKVPKEIIDRFIVEFVLDNDVVSRTKMN